MLFVSTSNAYIRCTYSLFNLSVHGAVQQILNDIFKCSLELPSRSCPVCSRSYKDMTTLRKHIIMKHPETYPLEGHSSSTTDSVLSHTQQLMKVLLMKRCLDYSIKTANGRVLSLLIKHMMLYFHHFPYKNYALACFEHTALVQVLLSDRDKALIEQECFVNNMGRRTTNLAMDLDVEHCNRFFKEHFHLKENTPSQHVLDRLSLSQDMLDKVLAQFWNEFGVSRHSSIRSINADSYQSDVRKLQEHIGPLQLFELKVGRKMHSAKLLAASHDPLLLVDMYQLKQWLQKSFTKLCDQRFVG